MKRILATTAIVALTAIPAYAQSQSSDQTSQSEAEATESNSGETSMQSNNDVNTDVNGMSISASELIGKTVYIRSDDTADDDIVDSVTGPGDDWENVGDINDVVLSQEGEIDGITLDVGGFLGIGAKEMSTSMDDLKFVAEEESDDEYYVVYTGNRAALEEGDELDREGMRGEGNSFFAQDDGADDEAEMSEEGSDDQAAMDEEGSDEQTEAPTDDTMDQADGGDAAAPALTDEERSALTAEDLEGVAVYDAANEHVGEISDFVLTDDGRISDVIVDIGGFLGLGEKPVAMSFDELELVRDEQAMGTDLRVRTDITEEEFDAMEEWAG